MLLLRGATPDGSNFTFSNWVSIHAPLARSNFILELSPGNTAGFNTCSSCEEQLSPVLASTALSAVSIHAPLARSNLPFRGCQNRARRFNTCSSCEEQQELSPLIGVVQLVFQYMLLLRGATERLRKRSRANRFQYMLLLRGATCCGSRYVTA